MKIGNVEFAGAIAQPGTRPPVALPQVAIAGRSNVGKSSLINRLLGRTRTPIARVSSTPGKTQEINFYRVRAKAEDERTLEFAIADLPGYGFARVPPELRRKWKPLVEGYLTGDGVVGVVQLIDSRHDPTTEDRQLVAYLTRLAVPSLFVLTKVDKLKREELKRSVARAREAVGSGALVATSSETGAGRDEMLEWLENLIKEHA